MEQSAGIDVSLDSASICVVDASGRVLRAAKAIGPANAVEARDSPVLRVGTVRRVTLAAPDRRRRDRPDRLEDRCHSAPGRPRGRRRVTPERRQYHHRRGPQGGQAMTGALGTRLP